MRCHPRTLLYLKRVACIRAAFSQLSTLVSPYSCNRPGIASEYVRLTGEDGSEDDDDDGDEGDEDDG